MQIYQCTFLFIYLKIDFQKHAEQFFVWKRNDRPNKFKTLCYKSLKIADDKLNQAIYVQMDLGLIQEKALELHARLRDNRNFKASTDY